MDESEINRSNRGRLSKRRRAPTSLTSQDESSQTSVTTASATISSAQSCSDSTGRRRHQISDGLGAKQIPKPSSDTKLINSEHSSTSTFGPKRLFQHSSHDNDGDASASSNDTVKRSQSLPQEKLNAFESAASTSSESDLSSEHVPLSVLRNRVEQQVQLMSQFLLESPSAGQNSKRKAWKSGDLAMRHFQALSTQVVTDFLDSPDTSAGHKRSQVPLQQHPQDAGSLTTADTESLDWHEQQQQEGPKVALLHQQRSKLQQRIRELVHESGRLRQERNSFQSQCLDQTRQIQSLHEALNDLQDEKTNSENVLQQQIYNLQSKSTQLLEELQKARRAQQQEAVLRGQIRNDVMQRMATLELEKKRLQRASRNSTQPKQQQTSDQEGTDFVLTPTRSKSLDAEATAAVSPSSLPPLPSGGSAIESSPGNERLLQMRSEVQNRRAKVEALRRNRSNKDKNDPNLSHRSLDSALPSPQTPALQEPPQLRKLHVDNSLTPGRLTGNQMNVTSFLDRIDSAMAASASKFANDSALIQLKQEIADLRQRNLNLEMSAQEADDHASSVEECSKETSMKLQEAMEREQSIKKQFEQGTKDWKTTKSALEALQQTHQEMLGKANELETRLSEAQSECADLQKKSRLVPALEQKQSELMEAVNTYKAQNRAMSSQIDELEMIVVEMEMANGGLEDRVRTAERDLQRQQELISKLSTELRSTSSREVASRKALESTVAKHSAQDKAKQQHMQEEIESRLSELSKKLEESQKHEETVKVELKQKEQEYKASMSELEKRHGVLKTKVVDLEQELDEVKQQSETMKSQNSKLRDDRKSQAMTISHAEDVQKELASKLVEAEMELEQQLKNTAVQDEELSRLIDLSLGVNRSVKSPASRESSPSKPQVSKQRQALESKFADVSDQLTATTEKRLELEKQLCDLQSHFHEDGKRGGEVATSRRLKELERAITKLRKECDQLTFKSTRAQDENDALKQLLSTSEQRQQEAEKRVSEYEYEIDRLREDAVVLEAKSIALQNDRKKLASENEIYSSIEIELESRLADATRLIDSSVPRIKELEREIGALEKNIEGRDSVVEALRTENMRLVEKAKNLELEKNALDQECSDVSSKLERQSSRFKELETSLQRKNEEMATLKSKIKALDDQLLNQDASKGHVGIIKAQILQLADIKKEVLKQVQPGSKADSHIERDDSASFDLVIELQDLRMVLETARDHISGTGESIRNLERKIDSLNDAKTYLSVRNRSLEKVIEEQRFCKDDIEKLILVRIRGLADRIEEWSLIIFVLQLQSTVPIQEKVGPTAAKENEQVTTRRHPVDKYEVERFQVNYADAEDCSDWLEFRVSPPRAVKGNGSLDVSPTPQDDADYYPVNEQGKTTLIHGDNASLGPFNSDDTSKSHSLISEIDSAWTQSLSSLISEVDSQGGSSKNFPPSEDVSELSHDSLFEPYFSSIEVPKEVGVIDMIQTTSSQLETVASTPTFQNLVTPRVTNAAQTRQQHPPEYSVTLGALNPNQQNRGTDHNFSTEDSPAVKKTLKY
eukprot:scaffold770_cov109-Cylindrotheca_fusiformis.AAC.23